MIQIWFGRYPNAEIVMQALLFGALLAWSRAHVDDDGFFAPVSASLLGLLLFLRFDTVLAFGGVAVAAALALATGQRRAARVVHRHVRAVGRVRRLVSVRADAALHGIPDRLHHESRAVADARARRRRDRARRVRVGREPRSRRCGASSRGCRRRSPSSCWCSRSTPISSAPKAARDASRCHDAIALRSFAWYITPLGLAVAFAGYALAMRTTFRRDPVLLATVTIFGLFFFYKIKIVPVHFWMARRFLPVILPGAMLLIGYAAFRALQQVASPGDGKRDTRDRAITARTVSARRRRDRRRIFVVTARLAVLARVAAAARRTSNTPASSRSSKRSRRISAIAISSIVESRAAGSELHVLALPLAYVYARNVLVLNTPRPDPIQFREFLRWARTQYEQVFFLGGGGTDLLDAIDRHRARHERPLPGARVGFTDERPPARPEPQGVRPGGVSFRRRRRTPACTARRDADVALDVGAQDDVNVVRFHLKEKDGHGVTYRWTQDASYISLVGVRKESKELVLVMNDGHRPKNLPPARVEVSLDDKVIGHVDVGRDFHTYAVPIPPAIAAEAAARETPARLKLAVTVWKPRDVLGTPDDRQLGVMVDRVEVR